jgi:hypothetical protein
MIRFFPFAFLGVMTLVWADSSWAQQKGTTGGPPPTKGQTPPATQGNQAATVQNPIHYGTMSQTPFFTNPAIQKQLQLTEPQMNQLKQSYGNFWAQYVKDQGAGQANTARSNMTAMTTNFNNQLLKAAQGTLDPTQFQRFRQLHWQGQGFSVFNDPSAIQQLNLSADQQTRIRAYAEQQSKTLNSVFGRSSADPQMAAKEYEKLRLQNDQFINSILSPQQQQALRSVLGEPYDFSPVGGIKK